MEVLIPVGCVILGKNLRYYYVVYVCYFTMVMTYMLYHKFRNDKNNCRSLLLPRGSGRQIFIIWLFCTGFTYKFRFVRLLVWIRCQVIITFLMQTPVEEKDSSFPAGLGLLSCSKMTKIKYTNYQLEHCIRCRFTIMLLKPTY